MIQKERRRVDAIFQRPRPTRKRLSVGRSKIPFRSPAPLGNQQMNLIKDDQMICKLAEVNFRFRQLGDV